MTRAFTIASQLGGRCWWRVVVYDSVEQLRDAAYQHLKREGVPREHWKDTDGCCHPAGRLYDGNSQVSFPRNGYRGVIRYAAPLLTPEIVGHELVHAAVATLRSFLGGRDVRLGNGHSGSLMREEQLAYLYGELFADLQRQL